jgi:3-deoxy-manno-octulosonate cytidylyltransferase (CMP-KDO synthetase)
MKKIACIIPARLQSSRFPRKMLATLQGKPLLQWVWEAATAVPLFNTVAFAVDSEEIGELIRSFGGKYYLTSPDCLNGTERLIELLHKRLVDADVWVNWQGDEPFVHEKMIRDLLQSCDKDDADVWTLKKKIHLLEEISSPHTAKVVCDHKGFALYFSRHAIPHYRDHRPDEKKNYYKHIGLYAFTREALQKISRLKSCDLEEAEQLEQLRFLYNGLRIRVHETQYEALGIDLPEHLAKAETHLKQKFQET